LGVPPPPPPGLNQIMCDLETSDLILGPQTTYKTYLQQ
jgi:hypothetical protein